MQQLVWLNQLKEFRWNILTGKYKSGQTAAVDILSGILYFSINYTLADVINSEDDAGVLSDILRYEVTWMGIW